MATSPWVPYGLVRALRAAPRTRYPHPEHRPLWTAAARIAGCHPDEVVLGAGTAELIHRLARALLAPGTVALVATPTFAEYAHASRLAGAEVVELRTYTPAGVAGERLLRQVHRHRPAVVWLCDPNNPTGHGWDRALLASLAAHLRRWGGHLVLDAAYAAMVQSPPLPAPSGASVIRLVGLTKSFGVPGVRVGIAVAASPLAAHLRDAAPPWPLAAEAEALLHWVATPAAQRWLRRNRRRLTRASARLRRGLARLGWRTWPSTTPFFVATHPRAAELATLVRDHGLRLRRLDDLGLPDGIRFAPRGHRADRHLLEVLRRA